jgi:polygalacturonase
MVQATLVLSAIFLVKVAVVASGCPLDIRDYGAKVAEASDPDAFWQNNTRAMQAAFTEATLSCHRVLVTGGDYASGDLYITSNIELTIASGARIVTAPNNSSSKAVI